MQQLNIIHNSHNNHTSHNSSNGSLTGHNGHNGGTKRNGYPQRDNAPSHRINHQIKSPSVRIVYDPQQITQSQEPSEILSLQKALELSMKLGVDLVEVSPKANPPVCKLINYGKFVYREQKNHKKEKHTKSKEIGCHINIGAHDLDTKIKHAHEFLTHHHQVVFKVAFRGREAVHKDLGIELLQTISEKLSDIGNPDGNPKINGKLAILRFSPKRQNKG